MPVSEPQVLEAEVVDEPGTELAPAAPVAQQPTNLFRTDDPAEVLKAAQATADALMPVVREKDLISKIGGRDHLRVEAWTTLGAMLGVTPYVIWTHPLENGWEARVEVRTLDGRAIGAAEAECLHSESTWAKRDSYALRSMAQTRATSKALASVLRFVATLAGVEGTPAEEMPAQAATPSAVIADPDELAAAKRALGRLCRDDDRDRPMTEEEKARALMLWSEALSVHEDRCPKGLALMLIRLGGESMPAPETTDPAPDTADLA